MQRFFIKQILICIQVRVEIHAPKFPPTCQNPFQNPKDLAFSSHRIIICVLSRMITVFSDFFSHNLWTIMETRETPMIVATIKFVTFPTTFRQSWKSIQTITPHTFSITRCAITRELLARNLPPLLFLCFLVQIDRPTKYFLSMNHIFPYYNHQVEQRPMFSQALK